MLDLRWPELRTILALGAHSDDIEIGAGATLLRLMREHPGLRVVWVVLSGGGIRGEEARASAARFLEGAAASVVELHEFRDGRFPLQWGEIKDVFEALKVHEPDLIFTHYGKDLHQDHRTVSELTWNAFRDHVILEYEIPKWDGGMGSPNAFVPASVADADRKIEILLSAFASQTSKHWFDDLTFRGLMRLRGMECCAPDALAEAFRVHERGVMERITDARADSARVKGARATGAAESRLGRALAGTGSRSRGRQRCRDPDSSMPGFAVGTGIEWAP